MPCSPTAVAHQRYLLKAFLHHPTEIMTQISVDGKDVVCSLMVCHEHIRCRRVDVFPSAHFNLYPAEQTEDPCPYPSGPIAHGTSETGHAAYDSESGCNKRCHQQQWHHNQKLIDAVENHGAKLQHQGRPHNRWKHVLSMNSLQARLCRPAAATAPRLRNRRSTIWAMAPSPVMLHAVPKESIAM